MKMKEVKHINIKKGMKVSELIEEYNNSGLSANKLAKSIDILELMIKDKECKVFLGIAGVMVSSGMRNIILDMIKNKYIDVLVITGANLTHDLVEALGYKHYQGTSNEDDFKLHKKGLVRMYNIYMPNKAYEKLEEFFNNNFNEFSKADNIKDFLWLIGKKINNESILKACYENKIPVFCPAISDSGIGLMVWNNLMNNKKINVNAFNDLKEILDIAWQCKKAGVFYIGGGVPKNYIQQAMQFSKGALYGIQITTDMAEYGGSSGADLREGISWGKMNKDGKFVDLRVDATIALPVIYAALKDRL